MLTFASYLADNARPVYARIAAHVEERLGQPAVLSGLEWADRLELLDEDRVDVAFLCGLPYTQRQETPGRPLELCCAPVMAAPRYEGRPVYFTDVVVRAESPARTFADLRDRTWAYNDEGSNSGYVMPRDHLLRLGETSGYFKEARRSGSHQRSLLMVLGGDADATGIDSTVLELERARRPELAGRLRVVESIGPCPIPPVVVARRLPETLKARLREVFIGMHDDPTGRAILAEGLMARFVPVRDADYDAIREMVRRARAAGFLELR